MRTGQKRKSSQNKPNGNRQNIKKYKSTKKVLAFLLCIGLAVLAGRRFLQRYEGRAGRTPGTQAEEGNIPRPMLDVDLLTVNEYSRPAIALNKVKGVVIHYTANPGTSAKNNRDYFEGLKDSHITKASSHFIIGLEGEIVQCIPCSEISYASNRRNIDTISIECCIEDDTGRFNRATYEAVVHLSAWLAERYQLEVSDIIRHYDVTGKNCPKYYVENPKAWEQLLSDVQTYLVRYGVT